MSAQKFAYEPCVAAVFWQNVFTGKNLNSTSGEGNPYLFIGAVLAHFRTVLLISAPNLQDPQ